MWRGFTPGFVNYKKGCTRLATASDKVYQLLAHGRWFSQGIPVSSTIKTGRRDIVEILLKVALNTINEWINPMIIHVQVILKVSPITNLIWMQSDKEHFKEICWIKIMHIRHKLLNIELYMIDWLIDWLCDIYQAVFQGGWMYVINLGCRTLNLETIWSCLKTSFFLVALFIVSVTLNGIVCQNVC